MLTQENSADAEIARRVNRWMTLKFKLQIFAYPCGLPQVGFGVTGSKDTDLSCHVPIFSFSCTV